MADEKFLSITNVSSKQMHVMIGNEDSIIDSQETKNIPIQQNGLIKGAIDHKEYMMPVATAIPLIYNGKDLLLYGIPIPELCNNGCRLKYNLMIGIGIFLAFLIIICVIISFKRKNNIL